MRKDSELAWFSIVKRKLQGDVITPYNYSEWCDGDEEAKHSSDCGLGCSN